MRRRDILRGSTFMLSALAAGRATQVPAFAAATNLFKASDVHPPGYPTVVAVENMGKKLVAATNGRLTIQADVRAFTDEADVVGLYATMCRDNKLPIIVFNLNVTGNIMRMSMGEPIGTLIH